MAEHPSIFTETAIAIPATRPAAHLAAGALLCCILAPAHAQQPASSQAPARCTPAKPCAPAVTSVPARAGSRQSPECGRLRAAIVESEQAERRVRAAMMESVQQDLSILRDRYRRLGCRTPART